MGTDIVVVLIAAKNGTLTSPLITPYSQLFFPRNLFLLPSVIPDVSVPRRTTLRALLNEGNERLLIEAAQRDRSRFAELYEQNFERVYAFIARRVSTREIAEDLTSEVFHHALAKLDTFEWRGVPFAAWLYRIAANVIADRWNRASTQHEVPTDTLDEQGFDDDTERRAMLFQLVDSLPDDQRTVVVQRFVEQRSIADIARGMQRSEGAIKQLQFRAMQSLRARVRSKHV